MTIRRERDKDYKTMRNKYTGIKALVLCLGTVVFIGANTKISAYATGAGVQLGTDVTDEIIPSANGQNIGTETNDSVSDESGETVSDETNATEGAIATDGNIITDGAENSSDGTVAVEAEEENASEGTDTTNTTLKAQTEEELNADSRLAYIVVENYSLEGGLLEAGNDITINLTIHNISSVASAESVVMTMSNASASVYPRYGTDNQIFIGKVKSGERKKISIPISVSTKFDGDATDFTCKFDYLSENSRLSNQSTMVITSSGGKSLIVKSVDLSTHAILNGKSLLNLNYSNKTNGNITDAELLIDGNIADENKVIRLDTVYAGKSYSKDFSVTFTKSGNQNVSIKLVYTDFSGERMQTDLGTFNVTVGEEVASQNVNEDSGLLLWGGRVIAAVCGLLAIFVGFVFYMKR